MFNNQSTATELDVVEDLSIEDYYHEKAVSNFAQVYTWYLAGMSLGNTSEIHAWFSFKKIDPSAVSLNLVHNAMVKAMLGDDHSIKVFDFPLPIRDYTRRDHHRFQNIMGIEPWVIVLSNAFSIASAFYIIFYIRERVSKAKLLQISSGLNMWIFWMASFLFDFATYIAMVIITILVLVLCQEQYWSTAKDLGPVTLVLVAFGFSMLPLTYILSFLFSNTSVGFISILLLTTVTGNSNLKIMASITLDRSTNFSLSQFFFRRESFRHNNATDTRRMGETVFPNSTTLRAL